MGDTFRRAPERHCLAASDEEAMVTFFAAQVVEVGTWPRAESLGR
jgi:hypothetical protein